MTEKQLIDSINKGELEAFHHLYKEYYPSLCIHAKNFTRNKDIAEEVVQDVFISIWEHKDHLNIESSLKSFLFVSVRNGCLNHLKHLQVVNKFNLYYTQLLKDAQDLFNVSQETGDSLLMANELEEKISKEIELLPEQCRRIFIMSRYDCLTHQEIADKLGVTINTVHRQTSIALEKLRLALKNYLIIFLLIIRILVG
jgi:RNA polymerase sigma-70 factor (ECF subfamily)